MLLRVRSVDLYAQSHYITSVGSFLLLRWYFFSFFFSTSITAIIIFIFSFCGCHLRICLRSPRLVPTHFAPALTIVPIKQLSQLGPKSASLCEASRLRHHAILQYLVTHPGGRVSEPHLFSFCLLLTRPFLEASTHSLSSTVLSFESSFPLL